VFSLSITIFPENMVLVNEKEIIIRKNNNKTFIPSIIMLSY